jgi:RND family efflux transporter MFP subunit
MTRIHSGTARLRGLLAVALVLGSAADLALAHEGHDHGNDKAALDITSLNRAATASEAFQVVAVQDGETLRLTIDHLSTNAPVIGASVTVTIGTMEHKAIAQPSGTHTIVTSDLAKPGRHELIISIKAGNVSDLLITALDVPEPVKSPGKPRIVADTPARLSDGSVFLPKITQRLISVATVPAAEASIETAVTLVGRIIADPNRSGVVQSTIAGRISAADGGLPRLGQPVTAGQVLGVVIPSYSAIDLTNVQQTGADLDQQIALAQNRVDQFRPLVRSNTLSPERLRTVEIELENLRKRRATLATSQRVELLTAPVDGVIAGMRALPGQVVSPQDVLFQIVDPKSLWVEALVFDPSVPDLAGEANATVASAPSLKLTFIGRSRALQQLSTQMHFAITDAPPSLNIGSAVTVFARTQERTSGLIVPKAAVVTAPSGEAIVWVHRDPERFHPRTVKMRPIDGDRVLIEAGIDQGDRVVISAAELINQVR